MAADAQDAARPGQAGSGGSRTGHATPDETGALARKLLDLWQDHLSALAQDPALMAQALTLMGAYSSLPWPPPGMPPTGGSGLAPFPFPVAGFPFGPAAAAPAGAPAGPPPAAAAPDAGAGAVGELRRRVAELEGRLAELERGGGKPAGKPGGKLGGKSGGKAAHKRARSARPRARKGG